MALASSSARTTATGSTARLTTEKFTWPLTRTRSKWRIRPWALRATSKTEATVSRRPSQPPQSTAMPWARRPNWLLAWSMAIRSARIPGSSPYLRWAFSITTCCSSARPWRVRTAALRTALVSSSASLRTSASSEACRWRSPLWTTWSSSRWRRSVSRSALSSALRLRSLMLVARARRTAPTATSATTTSAQMTGPCGNVMRLTSSAMAGNGLTPRHAARSQGSFATTVRRFGRCPSEGGAEEFIPPGMPPYAISPLEVR